MKTILPNGSGDIPRDLMTTKKAAKVRKGAYLCPTLIAELRAVENFCQMVLVFFLAPKTGTGLSCTIYEIPVKFSLSQDMTRLTLYSAKQMVQKNFNRFGKKRGKR